MKFSRWQIAVFALLPMLILAEMGALVFILKPGIEAGNPRWIFIDLLAMVTTIGLGNWQVKCILGPLMPTKEKPTWAKMKQLTNWYGSLGYIWLVLQFVIFFQLVRAVSGPNGVAWRIGLASEAIATFGLLMWWVHHKLAANPPRKMGSVLWPSYANCLMILSVDLIPAGHPIGMSPFAIENGRMDQSGIQMICYFVVFFGGLVYYGMKEKRARTVSV